MSTFLLFLTAFVGFVVLVRTVIAGLYLPFHLSLNRRGVPIEARETWMSWVAPVVRVVLILVFCFTAPAGLP